MSSSSEVLRAFLEHPNRPVGTLHLDELRGFLFAIANAPEVIVPSEWLPAVFDDQEPMYSSVEEARTIHEAMVEEFNAVNDASLTAPDPLPPGCIIRDDAMANLEQDAPLGRWARGFLAGHHWLEETWNEFLPDDDSELSEEFGVVVMVLGFFSSREMADAFNGETRGKDLPGMATTMVEAFPTAVAEYVSIGRSLGEESAEAPEPIRRAGPKVGRNDLCPCGSGRKYKRCCGAPN